MEKYAICEHADGSGKHLHLIFNLFQLENTSDLLEDVLTSVSEFESEQQIKKKYKNTGQIYLYMVADPLVAFSE